MTFVKTLLILEKLEILIQRALREKRLKKENKALKEENTSFQEKADARGQMLIGGSEGLRDILVKIEHAAPSKATVSDRRRNRYW